MNDRLKILAKHLEDELKKELAQQNHVACGKLNKSISVKLEDEVKTIKLVGRYVEYGKYVEYGRKAGGKRVPIDALIDWIRCKRFDLNGKSEKSLAFAIQHTIHEKGTQGKKNWQSNVLRDEMPRIRLDVTLAISEFSQAIINNIIRKQKTNIG